MKKLKNLLIFTLCILLAFALLAGCKDENTDGTENGGNGGNGGNGDGLFAITVTPSDDYEIIPSATSAAEGTDITLTVSSKSADKLVRHDAQEVGRGICFHYARFRRYAFGGSQNAYRSAFGRNGGICGKQSYLDSEEREP